MQNIIPLLLVASLPLYAIKIPLGTIGSLPLLDICLMLIPAFIFLQISRHHQWLAFLQHLFHEKKIMWAVLCVTSFLLAYTHAPFTKDWLSGLGLIKSYFFLPILCALVLSFYRKIHESFFPKFWQWYGTYTLILGGVTIVSFWLGRITFDGRVTLWFPSPNHLAMAIAPGLLVWFFVLLFPSARAYFSFVRAQLHHPIVLFGAITLHVAALLVTQSVGAMLAVGIILAGVIVKPLFSVLWVGKTIMGISIGSLLMILILSNIMLFAHYHCAVPPSSTDSRLAIYQVGVYVLGQHGVLGIGPGEFQSRYLDLQPLFPPYPQWAVPHAHHLLLHVWIEGGILALIAIIALIFISIGRVQKDNRVLDRLSFLILCYFLLHGLVDMPIWKNDQAVLWWLILLG